MRTKEIMKNQQSIAKNTKAIAAGGGGGSTITVRAGEADLTSISTLNFLSGAGIAENPSGTAEITISGGSSAKTGFSPVNVASCDSVLSFDPTTKWGVIFLTKVEEKMSLDNITIYGVDQESQPDPADGVVEIMIYNWGTGWNSADSTKKCGGTLATCGYGPNEISLVAEAGQSLEVAAGENIMIAIRKTSGTFQSVAVAALPQKMYNQIPNPEPAVDTPFPTLTPSADTADPTWGGAGIAPACTLWENPA